MFPIIKHLFSRWAWQMAWRDSRPVRWRLLLFSSSIIFGVAALVTIGSLRQNLNHAVQDQAKSLLGSDLMIASRQPFSPTTQQLFTRLRIEGAQQASEVSLTTMLRIGDDQAPKLVGLRGLEKTFPFYGQVETSPPDAWQKIQQSPGIIVEPSFLKSMNAEVGDMATFGNTRLPVLGVLLKAPPSASGFTTLSPAAVTSLDTLLASGLTGNKSLVFHRKYFKLPSKLDADTIVRNNRQLLAEQRLTHSTSRKRSENIEKAIDRLYTFFNLIGFSALFLGGIGIAGAIHVHVSERLKSVATLRCLGCSSAQAFAVYLVQSLCMGAAGSFLGLLTGCGLVSIIDILIHQLPANTLPFELSVSVNLNTALQATGIGLLITLSFALLPLLAVRRISPLQALRSNLKPQATGRRDPLRWLILAGLLLMAFLLTWLDAPDGEHSWRTPLGYVAFLVVAFLFLILSGFLLRWAARRVARPSWPFVIRQGIANLHRPNNQTSLFMASIGLGVFFILTLLLTQDILRQWLDPQRMESRPNLFLVDVPPDEENTIQSIMANHQVQLTGNAPIVQMRLTHIKGRPVNELIAPKDGSPRIPRWIQRREFRSTFRNNLSESEKLVEGNWVSNHQETDPDTPIPVSFEQKMAADLNIGIGDEVTISIEGFGEHKKLRVASLREVDWRSMNLNFFIVFPENSIDPYVSFNVLAAHSPTPETTANLQKSLFEQFPYVNSIDLSLILKTVQSVLTSAGQTIQMMAMFTVITGALVLIASILAGRRVRIRESVLLRTLGASRQQISRILATEYALLGSMATLAGASLALLASSLLGRLVFEGDPYEIPWLMLISTSSGVMITTVILGMLLSRGIASQPPLQILRAEDLH